MLVLVRGRRSQGCLGKLWDLLERGINKLLSKVSSKSFLWEDLYEVHNRLWIKRPGSRFHVYRDELHHCKYKEKAHFWMWSFRTAEFSWPFSKCISLTLQPILCYVWAGTHSELHHLPAIQIRNVSWRDPVTTIALFAQVQIGYLCWGIDYSSTIGELTAEQIHIYQHRLINLVQIELFPVLNRPL